MKDEGKLRIRYCGKCCCVTVVAGMNGRYLGCCLCKLRAPPWTHTYVAKLEELDEFVRAPVMMSSAEEARLLVKCVSAALAVGR